MTMQHITMNIGTSTTALVVIDLQQGIVRRSTAPYAASDVVTNAAALADAFRTRGMPVFLVRVTPSSDGKDALHPAAERSFETQRTPDWADIVPEMRQAETDFVITKRQWGAFYGTELDLQLRRRGIRTIVLCGISTNIGVESTARTAYELGYDQIFAEDAMAAMSAEEHAFSITRIFPRIGVIRSTREILTSLH